jgi:hypothetical protein
MPLSGIRTNRDNLGDRLASVVQASRAIRLEVEITICKSRETRLESRRLRRTAAKCAVCPPKMQMSKTPRIRGVADSIAQILANRGYSAFVVAPPQDTALIQ